MLRKQEQELISMAIHGGTNVLRLLRLNKCATQRETRDEQGDQNTTDDGTYVFIRALHEYVSTRPSLERTRLVKEIVQFRDLAIL